MLSLVLLLTAAAPEAPPKVLPRCLVMLAEQALGAGSAKYWWSGEKGFTADFDVAENTLAELLKAEGFVVVDRRVLAGKITADAAITKAEPGDEAVKEFALKTGADVVFVGKIVVVDAGVLMGTPMHSLQATISMRALNVDDAKILGSAATTATAANVEPTAGSAVALQKAAKKAGADLAAKVKESWTAPSSKILITVRGVKDWKRARDIEVKLKALANVTKLTQRTFKGKTAEFDVEYSGSSAALADQVVQGKTAKSVESVTQNTLVLSD